MPHCVIITEVRLQNHRLPIDERLPVVLLILLAFQRKNVSGE